MPDRTVLVEDFDDTRAFIRTRLEMKGCRVPVVAMWAGPWNASVKPMELELLDVSPGCYGA